MQETHKRLTHRAGIVGLGTLSSRILGLVRESVIVAYFPKEVVDAYTTAFVLPNSFRRLTAEGAFSTAVISVFSKIWTVEGLEASRRFVRATVGFALVFLLALTLLGTLGAEQLTWLASWASGGHAEKFALATRLTRVMFPYVLLISLTALTMGVLNSTGRFFAPAFTPVFLNLSIIGCAVGLSGTMPSFGIEPIFALALGVLIGGVAQVVFQLPSLHRAGLFVRPSFDFRHAGLKKVLKLSGPMIFGAAAYQVGIIFSNSLAWTLPHGSVMYIYAANRMMELPLAVLVMAISTAALPSLAALRGQGKTDEMKQAYGHALRLALFVATPAMVALAVLAEPVIAVIYQRGHFTHAETLQTAAGLRWLALGICSIALIRQTVPVFYALEKVWPPVIMSMLFIGAYVATAVPLKGPLLHQGLCIGMSAAASIQGLGLVVILRRLIGPLGFGATLRSWARVAGACVPMGVAAYGISLLGQWERGGNSVQNIAVLILTVIGGLGVYLGSAYLFRVVELRELVEALRARRKGS